jgi:hypothetical protein
MASETNSPFRTIGIDPAKPTRMSARLDAPNLEQAVIAIPVKFRFKARDGFTSGFLLLTRVALYLFKSKVFGTADFLSKINLFRITSIAIRSKELTIDIHQSPPATVKTADFATVGAALQTFI